MIQEFLRRPRARAALALAAPTATAFVVDLLTRGTELANVVGLSYLASIVLSLALWSLPLFVIAAIRSRVVRFIVWIAWLTPLSIFAFAGQGRER